MDLTYPVLTRGNTPCNLCMWSLLRTKYNRQMAKHRFFDLFQLYTLFGYILWISIENYRNTVRFIVEFQVIYVLAIDIGKLFSVVSHNSVQEETTIQILSEQLKKVQTFLGFFDSQDLSTIRRKLTRLLFQGLLFGCMNKYYY